MIGAAPSDVDAFGTFAPPNCTVSGAVNVVMSAPAFNPPRSVVLTNVLAAAF